MTISSLFIENIINYLYSDNVMKGGKLNNNQTTNKNNIFLIMILTFIYILIKGLIVYILYNILVPKLMYSLSKDKTMDEIMKNFKELTYIECVLLVILFNTLFSM